MSQNFTGGLPDHETPLVTTKRIPALTILTFTVASDYASLLVSNQGCTGSET